MSENGYMSTEDERAADAAFIRKPILTGQALRMDEIYSVAAAYNKTLLRLCPPSRERATATASIEGSVMWAVEAIRRNESAIQPDVPSS